MRRLRECGGLTPLSFLAPKGANAGETPANRAERKDWVKSRKRELRSGAPKMSHMLKLFRKNSIRV